MARISRAVENREIHIHQTEAHLVGLGLALVQMIRQKLTS